MTLAPGGQPAVGVHARFAGLVEGLPGDAVVAVDMPIGLPDLTGKGGRGPEALVRPLLGQRQSSVFSIPSRAAVYAAQEPFTTLERWYEAHRAASATARQTSQPPRAVSIQAFGIFPKIREIDALLRERADLRQRVIESHPEVAFWRLNGGQAMRLPKKVKGMVNPPGMAERRTSAPWPWPCRRISRADAAARCCHGRLPRRLCAAVHRSAPCARAKHGHFQTRPARTATALPMAIWA